MWRCALLALWAWGVQGQCDDVATCSDPAELWNLQLLQVAGPVLQRSGDWNFTQVMQDVPKGSFLSKLDVLVRMIGITYNTTSPRVGKAPPNVTTRDGAVWTRLPEFDRDPKPGGVFARAFHRGSEGSDTVILVFKGVCTDAKLEQCRIDLCYLKEIQNYGPVTGKVLELMGFDARSCDQYRSFLNFTEQALALVSAIQTAYPRSQLVLTGHSLGGMLAMTVAQQVSLRALAFAPTPWKHVPMSQAVQTLEFPVPELVSLCDPYDCGINAFFVPGARLSSTTCLFLQQEEPKTCEGFVEPYLNHTWRQQLESQSPSDFLVPLLLCKGSAHRWPHYESMVEVAARTQKFPRCSRDFSVLTAAAAEE